MAPKKHPHEYIFIPLDTPKLDEAIKITKDLKNLIGGVKIGKEFFTALGPEGVKKIKELDVPIFIDLKFHDIPNTVAGAVRSTIHLKPSILNVHAQGGREMLRTARDTVLEESIKVGIKPPLLLGVTVLTSLGDQDLKEVGVNNTTLDQVKHLTALCQKTGLDGVVCSASEITALRAICNKEFKLLTPGIRPKWAKNNDQKRIVTPGEAIKYGADYLVIGRPIYGSSNPILAAKRIISEIAESIQ